MRYLTIAVVCLCALSIAADEPTIKNIAARGALTKYRQTCQQADEAARKARATAAKELVSALEQAKVAAMKAGSLEDATAIAAEIEKAKGAMDAVPVNFNQRLSGSKWTWSDAGKTNRFELHEDHTTRTTWNAEVGVWVVLDDGSLLARINANGGPTKFKISPDVKVLVREDGKIVSRQ